MVAVVAGLGAATAFAASTLASTRASRLIGATPTVAWVTAIGLPLALAAALVDRSGLSMAAVQWLAIAGLGNVGGLLLAYRALRIGPVSVVAPIVSTEGAMAALFSVATGGTISLALLGALALVVAGGALTAATASPAPDEASMPTNSGATRLAAGLAIVSAVLFGASLYATGQIGRTLPLGWAALAPRATGVLLVGVPMAVRGRLVLTRSAAPLVLVAGVAEVVGFSLIGLGSRSDVAVTAVLTSQFAAVAVLGAVVLFGERLGWPQRIGVVAVAVGTALVAAVQA
jgi:drug/metabolite transporter (DMT)-like permease